MDYVNLVTPLRELFIAHVLPLLDVDARALVRVASEAHYATDEDFCPPRSLQAKYSPFHGSDVGRDLSVVYHHLARIGWDRLPCISWEIDIAVWDWVNVVVRSHSWSVRFNPETWSGRKYHTMSIRATPRYFGITAYYHREDGHEGDDPGDVTWGSSSPLELYCFIHALPPKYWERGCDLTDLVPLVKDVFDWTM